MALLVSEVESMGSGLHGCGPRVSSSVFGAASCMVSLIAKSRKKRGGATGRMRLPEHTPTDPPAPAMVMSIRTRMDRPGFRAPGLIAEPLHIPALTQELGGILRIQAITLHASRSTNV